MEEFYDLIESMSPKLRTRKRISKGPRLLSLKSHFRRSKVFDNRRKSVIIIESSSSSSSDSDSSITSINRPKIDNDIAIVISETSFSSQSSDIVPFPKPKNESELLKIESSLNTLSLTSKRTEATKEPIERFNDCLSQEKKNRIKAWVENVNKEKERDRSCDESVFKDFEDELNDKDSSRERDFKHTSSKNDILNDSVDIINDSFDSRNSSARKPNNFNNNEKKSENDSEDSLSLPFIDGNNVNTVRKLGFNITEALNTQNNCNETNCLYSASPKLEELDDTGSEKHKNFADILDKLYGESWRKMQDSVLPKSEKKPKKEQSRDLGNVCKTERTKKTSLLYKNPYLEKNGGLVGSKNSTAEAIRTAKFPWTANLKNVCDLDTSSDSERLILEPKKLNFDDENEVPQSLNTEKILKKYTHINTPIKTPKNETKSVKKGEGDIVEKQKIPSYSLDSGSSSDETNSKWMTVRKPTRTPKNLPPGKSSDGTYSFLASLEAKIPMSECHPSAKTFRINNFNSIRDALARKLYALFNGAVFENKLPSDMELVWNDRLLGTAGRCDCKKITRRTGAIERNARIQLASKILDSPERLRNTLIHEMCHAATWIINKISNGHGPLWQAWATKAMKTFPEIPPIKRCHDYEINTKYTYRCMDCGYRIGRHSKSLNIERKVCGYCKGKFEILINKKTKEGVVKSVPVAQKKPATGFALFVKENYANHKTDQLNHADVMKLLGKKFAELKVNK